MPLLIPELIYHAGRFHSGWALEYDAVRGRILRVGPAVELAGGGAEAGSERLPGRALLPGFTNTHSHAFQRLIRGRTQWRTAAEHSDFWSWREAMYAAALALSPEAVHVVSRFCFLEMLRAGYTSVGEFHYLHRGPDGRSYHEPTELALRVLAAADEVGIRIVLLDTCYAAGGIGQPLRPEQRRFATPDLDEFLRHAERLVASSRTAGAATVGIAAHSLRALPRNWLGPLRAFAAQQGMPFHMHVSEQPAEVEACRAAFGLRPVELLADEGVLDERFTAVHAIHLSPREIRLLGRARATVCACPSTERDLGDGMVPAAALLAAGARLALGSDSQMAVDPFEEMRLLEYHERLQKQRRVILASPAGADPGRLEAAPLLLGAAAAAGADALHLDAGRLEPGRLADFIAIDLDHPAHAGWTADTLPALLVFAAPAAAVTDVWVGGRRHLAGWRHDLDGDAAAAYRAVAASLPPGGAA